MTARAKDLFVNPVRPILAFSPRFCRVLAGVGALGLMWLAVPEAAQAQGKLDARYEATLAGIPVGKGAWTIEVMDDQFAAAASGGTAGLLKAFSGGSGTSQSQGRIINGALGQAGDLANHNMQKKSEQIRMTEVNGYVKEFSIDPEPPVDPDRIPVTDAHRHNVFDPMTGSLLRVPGNAELMSPDSCHAGQAIFDGRMRYDLKLDFKRMENVRSEKGYSGPALVCAIYFSAVSGYIPDRPVIKYLTNQRNMEVVLVPIAGTRVLVPYRVTVPTPIGTAVLEATEFLTSATPPAHPKTN